MNVEFLIRISLPYGLILGALLSVLLIASLRWNASMWVGDYPEDIQTVFGEMSSKTQKQRNLVAILFLGSIVSVLILSLNALAAQTEATFWIVFVHSTVLVAVFNLIDLILLDWLFFVYIQPDFIILPGTVGLAGYKDYGFHFRGWLVGNLFSLTFGLITAGIYFLGTLL